MTAADLLAFLPELVLLTGALVLFFVSLGEGRERAAFAAAAATAAAAVGTAALCLGQEAVLFGGAYRVDLFSQLLKLAFAVGLGVTVLLNRRVDDIRGDVRAEYYLLLVVCVTGLSLLVSCVDLVALVVALELAAFPLYVMVPMRREREGQISQMESAIKYIMFGIAANGIMFFGMSYLFGLTGTTSLAGIAVRLQPVIDSPLALTGLALTCCGLFFKLAVFPFHFWTPDVYQGAANETAGVVASLPKLGATAVLVRLVSLASPASQTLPLLLTVLAIASMLYGNLIALRQTDFKRLLGFSGIAHAGYTLVGLVALDQAGYTAALYYSLGYLLMVLACFVVISAASPDGSNLKLADLAGLHRRSPLLAATLVVGVFALAGIPPFLGFMGKFALLSAALARGHLVLVIAAVVNAAIAVYYYLAVVREACFRDPGDLPAIRVHWSTRGVCLFLIGGIVLLGVAPASVLDLLSASLSGLSVPPP